MSPVTFLSVMLGQYRHVDVCGGDVQDDDAGDSVEKMVALEERVAALEGRRDGERQETQVDTSADDDEQGTQWRPPRREHGLPDAGVVTLEERPDEGHAFGPAAPLVAEWRKLRTGGEASRSRVDRAWALARRWELEIAMLGDYGLTLPPETEPLDASRREDHLRWRKEALRAARKELSKAKWLRRVLTLGLRWR